MLRRRKDLLICIPANSVSNLPMIETFMILTDLQTDMEYIESNTLPNQSMTVSHVLLGETARFLEELPATVSYLRI